MDGPGCNVESTTFFACHNSRVINGTWLCLYDETRRFALSKPDGDTSRVLPTVSGVNSNCTHVPWIRDIGRMAHAPPVGGQVILGRRKVPIARERRRHGMRRELSLKRKPRMSQVLLKNPIQGGEPISAANQRPSAFW